MRYEEINDLCNRAINAINDITLSRDFLKKESVSLSYNPDRDFLVNAEEYHKLFQIS